jgi:hypothetical protein
VSGIAWEKAVPQASPQWFSLSSPLAGGIFQVVENFVSLAE